MSCYDLAAETFWLVDELSQQETGQRQRSRKPEQIDKPVVPTKYAPKAGPIVIDRLSAMPCNPMASPRRAGEKVGTKTLEAVV